MTPLREILSGNITYNLTYGEEGIENTFKEGGKNYRKEIGPINGNNDYISNPVFNMYDLYIPNSAFKTLKAKGIILFIHGGAWVVGRRQDIFFLPQLYFEHEYIIANMDYTLLNMTNFTIYRILDDVTACIKHIVKTLKSKGFNEKELQLAIGGVSAGAHIALLYSYLVKEPPLEIKFIIDIIGPVTLNPDDFYSIYKDEDTLPNLDPTTVNEALKNNKYNKTILPDNFTLLFLNSFIGKEYSQEELDEMLDNSGQINKTNEKYIALYEKAKYGFVTTWIKEKKIPILAFYGGKDQLIGFPHYARLKEADDSRHDIIYKNNIQLVYARYQSHSFIDFNHTENIEAAKDLHYYILKFCEDYFE